MEHTFANGDVLVILRTPRPGASVTRGSIIVFANPYRQTEMLVKRVVAVGGDRVKIQDGHLIVNGRYRAEESSIRSWKDSWGWFGDDPDGVLVPEARYFVLSDNRSSLADSRSFGSVPAGLVRGLVIASW
jgi:signal peptidase I